MRLIKSQSWYNCPRPFGIEQVEMGLMTAARCPVCNDLISPGVTVKLNQAIICPTCLANLNVVSVSPLEFEETNRTNGGGRSTEYRSGKKSKHSGKREHSRVPSWGLEDPSDDDYAEFDDYIIERRLRHKNGRPRSEKGQI